MYTDIYLEKYYSSTEDQYPLITTEQINNLLRENSCIVTETGEILMESAPDIPGIVAKALKKPLSFFTAVGLNVNYIMRFATEMTTYSIITISSNGLNKRSFDMIAKKNIELTNKFVKYIMDSTDFDKVAEKAHVPKNEKLVQAFISTFTACIINVLFEGILSLFLTHSVARTATAILCAPIIEEMMKRIAVKGGYIKEFTIVFNLVEFSQYVGKFSAIPGIKILNLILIRLAGVGLHLVTTVIHWLSNNVPLLTKLGVRPEDHEKIEILGSALGVAIHCAWNSGAGSILLKPLLNDLI